MVEFSRMNSTSFERLIRALAFEIFGPGGTVYSSGPDGGRDFTIEGKIRGYEDRGWDGYLVIQAKFKEKAEAGDDVKWLKTQLELEHTKLASGSSAPRCPNYYIIATNVSLSGADGQTSTGSQRTGGHKKITAVLDDWRVAPGIKDFDVWAADKLADLLAGKPAVAQTFAAWTTPGDVLTALLTKLKAQDPDFAAVIRRAMKSELRRDQYARLKDAGSVDNEEIPTSQVFVDLPINIGRRDQTPRYALESLIRLSRGTFNEDPSDKRGNALKTPNNRIVLMGGPGQGKSTLTTFLIQVFRAVILQDDPSLQWDTTVKLIVPGILERATQENVDLDIPRRYPVAVSLPRYADAIAFSRENNLPIPSLLSFFADCFTVTADQKISREDLRLWLHRYPWVLVLDGLDEVPASGERTAVLDSLRAFESEVAEANGDVLFIVTTRPQGYNQDFDPKEWRHWHLMDLNPTQALRYAEELGKALHRDDSSRRADVLAALTQASSRPATSRLMVNPLQVTIMHMIVDTGGGVPPGRWNLFNEYYEVLKRREKAKGGEIRRILERNWNWLGPVHQRIGLMLHVESEISGGANSYLSPIQFEALVRDYLCSESLTVEDARVHAKELRGLAVDRLVLLSAKEQDRIAFDVRSLQEFMAAFAITSNPTTVEERLKVISKASHWRNVFLIASSRCFDDDSFHHLRSSVMNITRELETDPNQYFMKMGANLALDMFHDGLAVEHPQFRRQLAIHSLELLSLGPMDFDHRIAGLYEQTTAEVVNQHLVSSLTTNIDGNEAAAAWIMALKLWDLTGDEIHRLVEQNVPGIEQLAPIILKITPPIPSLATAESIKSEIYKTNPQEITYILQQYFRNDLNNTSSNDEILRQLIPHRERKDAAIQLFRTESSTVCLTIDSIEDREPLFFIDCPPGSPWEILNVFSRFKEAPSSTAMADSLEWISASDERFEDAKKLRFRAPWPIETLLSISEDKDHLILLSQHVRLGEYGDTSSWNAAELRWASDGITEKDCDYIARNAQPFGKDVAVVGLPITNSLAVARETHPRMGRMTFREMLTFTSGLSATQAKSMLSNALLYSADEVPDELADVDVVRMLIQLLSNEPDASPIEIFGLIPSELWDNDEMADLIAKAAARPILYYSYLNNFDAVEVFIKKYAEAPARRGALLKLAYAALQVPRGHAEMFTRISNVDLNLYPEDAADVTCVKTILRYLFKEIEDDADLSIFLNSSYSILPIFALDLLSREDVDPARAARIALGVIKILRAHPENAPFSVRSALEKALNRLPSQIHDRAEWERLCLPPEARPKLDEGRRPVS